MVPPQNLNQLDVANAMNAVAATFGQKSGVYIRERELAILSAVDAKLATLSGNNAAVASFLESVAKMVDAVPGTPEFDAGTNLFSFISTKFETMQLYVNGLEGNVTELSTHVDSLVTDLVSLAGRVAALEVHASSVDSSLAAIGSYAASVNAALQAFVGHVAEYTATFDAALRGNFGGRGLSTIIRPTIVEAPAPTIVN